MTGKDAVHVELQHQQPVRIFRSAKAAASYEAQHPEAKIAVSSYSSAVATIRHLVFARAKNVCAWCDKPIHWGDFHMHELRPRGQGGEISVWNSIAICPRCHMNIAHGNRKVRFGEVQ